MPQAWRYCEICVMCGKRRHMFGRAGSCATERYRAPHAHVSMSARKPCAFAVTLHAVWLPVRRMCARAAPSPRPALLRDFQPDIAYARHAPSFSSSAKAAEIRRSDARMKKTPRAERRLRHHRDAPFICGRCRPPPRPATIAKHMLQPARHVEHARRQRDTPPAPAAQRWILR